MSEALMAVEGSEVTVLEYVPGGAEFGNGDANSDLNDRSFITNFDRKIRFVYDRAIGTYRQQSGNDILEIREDAYWDMGFLDKSMNALHLKAGVDYNKDYLENASKDFWAIFDKIALKERVTYQKVTGVDMQAYMDMIKSVKKGWNR